MPDFSEITDKEIADMVRTRICPKINALSDECDLTEEVLKRLDKPKGVNPVKCSIICIFTPTGHTYTFRNCEIVCDNETVLQFRYSAMSDGKSKTATFPKATLCGWSTTE